MAGYDRESEVKAFDDTMAGVKGLVDAGVTVIPRFFHHPPEAADIAEPTPANRPKISVIDLGIVDGGVSGREAVVELVRQASETYGFFQVVNHGIPLFLLDDMLEGVRRFNEQDLAVKRPYYTRSLVDKVRFNANFDLFKSPAANWRDTLTCQMAPEPAAKAEDLPDVVREIILDYTREVRRLGGVVFELLSEALVGVQPLKELISNDKLKSGVHRVRANMIGPRVSVACFFSTSYHPSPRHYGPIQELLTENELPKYKEVNVSEYSFYSYAKGLDGKPTLDHFRV